MKEADFLSKLKVEGSLKLQDPSENISSSYLVKSEKCIKVARLAFDAGIYENSVSEAYFSIYNTVLSLFFKCGMKCENHSAAVILIKKLFNLHEQYKIFSKLKKERIDNQYYVPDDEDEPITKNRCEKIINEAKRFNAGLRSYMGKLKVEDIGQIRKKISEI